MRRDGVRVRTFVTVLVALACSTFRARAQAEPNPETYALSYVRGVAAEICPSRHELEREVSTRLGRSPFDPSAERSIEILLEHTPDGFRSVVSATDRDGKLLGRRTLLSDDATCAPIFSATALAVALLVDPEAALVRDSGANEAVGRFEIDEPTAPPPLPPPSAPSAPSPARTPPPPAPVAANAPPPRDASALATGAEAVVTLGMVPALSPGVGIFTEGLLAKPWGFALSGLYVSKASVTEGEVVLDVSLTTFGAALTFSPVLGLGRSLRFLADAGLSAGALHVGVLGARAVDSGDHFYFALGAGARAQITVFDGFFVTAGLRAAVPFMQRGLFVEGEDEPIWREPPVGGLASLGAGWAFF